MNDAEASQQVRVIDDMYAGALKSFQAGDLDGVLGHWHEDGVYLWPAVPPAIGKQQIRAAYEGFFAAWTAAETYHKHEIEVLGDLAYRRFSTELTLTPKPNGPQSRNGSVRMRLNGIHVYKRAEDGSWLFKVVIANDAPIDGAPAAHPAPAAGSGATATAQDEGARTGEPVPGFPMRYTWQTGPWEAIFDKQIDLIRSDMRRAKAEDKLIVYLSCPISPRGGGHAGTNVDVAKHVERALLDRWGEAFWILNPAQYQLESKAGTGLINRHAKELGIDLAELLATSRPHGGDYMRMWTSVLVGNGERVGNRRIANPGLLNSGQYFDAFYFIGPRDVQSFFLGEGKTLTAGIQAYFARKDANDPDVRDDFSVPGITWGGAAAGTGEARDEWERRRIEFLRYYSVRASVNYSLGSHDEWLIFRLLNQRRREASRDPGRFMADGDVGEQIAGFFDGGQIDPASSQAGVSRGYSL
ncbi:YybH family protein [Azospirillum sp. sgz301742]